MNELARDEIAEVQRLPLWKGCLDKMRREGVEYGKVYDAEFFERELRCNREAMRFGLEVAAIRRELEADGFYLSARGQRGNQYVILPPASNAAVMAAYQRKAADALRRGVILGTSTPLDTLTPTERRRHETLLERMAIKSALMSRAGKIHRFVMEKKPALLAVKG